MKRVLVLLLLCLEPTFAAAQHTNTNADHNQMSAVCSTMKMTPFQLPEWMSELPTIKLIRQSPLVQSIVRSPTTQRVITSLIQRIDKNGFWNSTAPSVAKIMRARVETDINFLQNSDPHLFQNLNMQMWSIRYDPQITTPTCYIVYLFSYVASWLSLTIFLGLIQESDLDVGLNDSRAAKAHTYFGWLAFVTNLMYALSVGACTDSMDCGSRSRRKFNFIWAGIVLIIFGGMRNWSSQKEDKKLEKYLMERQSKLDRMFQQDPQYLTNSIFAAHRKHMESLRNLQYMAEEAGGHDTDGVDSVVLKPVQDHPRSLSDLFTSGRAMLTLGVAWVVVIIGLTTTACTDHW